MICGKRDGVTGWEEGRMRVCDDKLEEGWGDRGGGGG